MIRTLRTRLVAAAMLSLLVVLTVILGVILLGSYRGIVSDADRILDLLAEGEGTFPTLPADFNWEEEGPRRRSPELGYEIRYFSVLLDESGNVATTDLGQIAAVDQETAEAYAQQVRAQGHTRGFLQDYRYLTAQEGDQTRVIFLDYSGYLFTFRSTLFTGLWVSAVGLLAVFLLLLLLSRRIIRPILESYEKQKRFITDAGHELKTPIAIIKGQLEGMIYQVGEYKDRDTYLRRCMKTTNDMEALVKEILSAARMGGSDFHLERTDLDISQMLRKVCQQFRGRMEDKQIELRMDIQPEYHYQGDRRLMEKVFTNVIGNAVAYSPAGAVITVIQKDEVFSVENTGVHIAEEDLERIFTPFYRVDKSRNRNSGGSGLGLYITKTILDHHEIIHNIVNTENGVKFTAFLW